MKRRNLTGLSVLLAVALAFAVALPVLAQTPTPTGPAQTPAGATPTSAANQAMVRVVHAAPNVGPVDVNSGGSPVFCNVAYKGVTRYIAAAPGTFSFTIVPVSGPSTTGTPAATSSPAATGSPSGAGTPAATGSPSGGISGSATLTAGQAYSVVAVGTGSSVQTLALSDDLSAPPSGQAKVRFVHASPDAPAVDVAVSGGQTLFSNVAYKNASNYATVGAGTVSLEVRPTGSTNAVLTIPNVNLNSGTVYTIYAVGLVKGSPSLQALMTIESVGGTPVPSNPTS